ncbi:insulinase family protein, partial [Patescibacteria group bacterium]|nr:insulinase family protein [Patescibacteria group bacterium]
IKSREVGTKRPKITPAGKARTRVIKKDIQQLHFCLGLTTFERANQDRYVLTLLNTILGGNTSSHLWEEIREKRGLVYYVGSSTDSFFDTGYLVVRAGCDVNRAEEALKVTLDELQKMSHRASGRELQDAKEYIKGHLALSLEDSQNVADLFGEDALIEGKVRTVESIIKGIDQVTVGEVTALAKKLLVKSRLNLTVVGPLSTRTASLA